MTIFLKEKVDFFSCNPSKAGYNRYYIVFENRRRGIHNVSNVIIFLSSYFLSPAFTAIILYHNSIRLHFYGFKQMACRCAVIVWTYFILFLRS